MRSSWHGSCVSKETAAFVSVEPFEIDKMHNKFRFSYLLFSCREFLPRGDSVDVGLYGGSDNKDIFASLTTAVPSENELRDGPGLVGKMTRPGSVKNQMLEKSKWPQGGDR